MKKWEIINTLKTTHENSNIEDIINILLENRGLKTKEEIENFLHPTLRDVTPQSVGIDNKKLQKALKRVQKAIVDKEQIVIFGDYDVDGITGTAILWETLYALSANVLPYIPHRVDEGYGLSVKGIENVKEKILLSGKGGLIITVDNGIVAQEAVKFAKSLGIDVIITDHHTKEEIVPDAYAIVHSTNVCGAAVGWLFAQEINGHNDVAKHLDLVALATVADLVPLTGASRALLKEGLPYVQHTKRIGLQMLFEEAHIDPQKIGVYEIGHIIGPRLNAMGRLESAMDSLRLLCTTNKERAKMLATTLNITNRERQLLTQSASLHAIEKFKVHNDKLKKLLFITEHYEEGIIGLVAGKLVEAYYRPAIVLSKGEKVSKASARSITGFNIIEFIRSYTHLLINAGGHPMAAGFTIETEKILDLQQALEALAEEMIPEELLTKVLKIDCELSCSLITQSLYTAIQALSPFGMGNSEPVFMSRHMKIENPMVIGRDKKHLKFFSTDDNISIESIAFGMGDIYSQLKKNPYVDIAYIIDENEWNGRKKLQLVIKDIKILEDIN